MEKTSSIQSSIMLSIASVVILLMAVSMLFMADRQKQMVQTMAIEKAHDIANSYFDGINTMMLTGSMAQSKVLRDKLLAHPDIDDIRLIRGPDIVKTFGPGGMEQSAVDDIDTRALAGTDVTELSGTGNQQSVTIAEPLVASSNFHGINCLTCHAVSEGTVLGAVRVTYSLTSLYSKINHDLVYAGVIALGMFIVGMVLITLLMRKIVVNPLGEMCNTMNVIRQHADLRQRLNMTSNDEIGQLSTSFNAMLTSFGDILNQVSDTSYHLSQAASQISIVAGQTTDAASQQNRETESVLHAINQLQDSVQNVRQGASGAAQASVEADQQAAHGAATTKNAIDGIYALVNEIERAADVIKRLDDKSKGVGSVLDVIKGLAEQTNLLALNAAIEAARAGEQGRGFAVVADEVRTLATRSHQATEEIQNIIDQLQHEAKDAVAAMTNAKLSAEQRRSQVESADDGLNLIAEKVTHIRQLNAQMANIADSQSQTAQNVSQSVANISRLTEHTAKDADQTNAASQELVRLVNRLNELVSQFKR